MKPTPRTRGTQQHIEVWLGEAAQRLGSLGFMSQGTRQSSVFQYGEGWLADRERFMISPDLPLLADRQFRKAPGRNDSLFHFAIADTEPDGWGCRVIARDHARQRRQAGAVEARALNELDYLLGVDDFSRVGALRLRDAAGRFVRATEEGERGTPPLLELADLLSASHALKTWLTEDTGPTGSIDDALDAAAHFHLTPEAALRILGEVFTATSTWRELARTPAIHMTPQEIEAFEPAFEHSAEQQARQRLGR